LFAIEFLSMSRYFEICMLLAYFLLGILLMYNLKIKIINKFKIEYTYKIYII